MAEVNGEEANGDQVDTEKTDTGPPGKGPRRWLFIALGLAAALGLVAVFAAYSLGLIGGARGNAKKFFEALSESDAATALSYVDQSNIENSALLTDEVLRKSNELGKITDIKVAWLAGDSRKSVTVDFKMGGEPQSGWYDVAKIDGEWKLTAGAFKAPVRVSNPGGGEGLPPFEVNGVEVNVDDFYIFPGSYEFTSSNENFTWTQDGDKSVLLGGILMSPTVIKPDITEGGEANIRKAIDDYFAACAAQKVLEPPGCPFSVGDRREIDLSTLVYEVTATPMEGAFDAAVVKRPVEFTVATSYLYQDGTPGGTQEDGYVYSNVANLAVDLTKEPPAVALASP